jgi:hypothetical protein
MLTKTPLQANMSYIQAGRDRFESGIPAGSVSGLVWADKAGTLYLEESDDDGVTWSQTTNVSVSASTTTVLPWTALTKQQYRFRYVNGAAAQTKFRLVQQTRGMELTTVDLSPLENRIDAITSGDTPATAQLTGSILAEQKTQADADNNVITFTGDITAIEIYHKEATWQEFIVNGITITIPVGGYRTPIGGTVAKTVTIPAGIDCIVGRLV